ncbi:MAG: sodium/solute symporter [Campylobacterales bacterium]
MELPVLISFSIYMAGMVAIGLYFYFKTENLGDYVLGGRGLGPGVTALSAGASDMSGWLLLGLPGMMYSDGIVGSWIALGLLIGAYVNWHYVARPLRIMTHRLGDAITIPDYFSNRFDDTKGQLRLDYSVALAVGSVIIVSYTFLGGYNAVSWTDFIQGILMMLALIVTPLVVINHVGGVSQSLDIIESIDPSRLNILHGASIIGVLSLMAWGLGYFGQPHILVRFMSIRHEDEMRHAKIVGMSWMGISIVGSLMVGFFGLAYVASAGVDLADPEKIFITLSQLLFNPWIAGFLLAAILAAIMSTIDSQLLVSSSVLTRDIYHAVLRKNASDRELVWIGRATVIAIALIAWYLSTDKNSSVLALVAYAWAGFGAAFGPLIILSLYRRDVTKGAAIAGMVTGSVTVIVWKQLEGGLFDLYEILPGFIAAWIAIRLFSPVTTPVSDTVLEQFDETNKDYKHPKGKQ